MTSYLTRQSEWQTPQAYSASVVRIEDVEDASRE